MQQPVLIIIRTDAAASTDNDAADKADNVAAEHMVTTQLLVYCVCVC